MIIAFLNWSVYKTAKTHINAFKIQVESVSGLDESLQQEMIRRKAERRAAADVNIIVVSSFLCFLPPWICGLLRIFAGGVKVPAEATLITNGCFMVSAFCNPLIYSIRKRDFRTSVKNLLRRFGQFAGNRNLIGVNNWKLKKSLGRESTSKDDFVWSRNRGTQRRLFPNCSKIASRRQRGRTVRGPEFMSPR